MSDETKKTTEGSEKDAIDMTKFVPKEDFEKLTKTSNEEVEKIKGELDQAKLSLLDPDYVAFLDSKKGKEIKEEAKEISEKIEEGKASPAELKRLEDRMNTISSSVENVLAVLELQAVEKKYADFGDFREATKKILETSATSLSIEQAYLLSKGQAKTEKTEAEKKAAAKTAAEKPSGTVPGNEPVQKHFTDKGAAGEDAWDKTVGAGKETL